jgi:hypothetical protein
VLKKRIYCLHVYLFFNWSLATLITQSVGRWDIHKVKFWRGVSLVSHIHFANYCFLFCKVNIIESNHLMTLLDTYGAANEQEINLSKLKVFFSQNMSRVAQEDLSGTMRVRHWWVDAHTLAYLLCWEEKKTTFGYVKDMVRRKINSLRGRALSIQLACLKSDGRIFKTYFHTFNMTMIVNL